MIGKIIKIVSNQYTVEINNKQYECSAAGKFRNLKVTPLVGDECIVDLDKLVIKDIKSRRNSLERPPVANVDNALIITSLKQPDLSLNLLDKLISNVLLKKITPIIIFSKLDLLNYHEKKEYKQIIKYYKSIGIAVFNNNQIRKLKKYLKNSINVLTGQSGAGKSSLLNKLDNTLNLKTSPISLALNRGVHTTRHVQLYNVDNFYIVDTPGFSALDISNYAIEDIKATFTEFSNYHCKYKDCNHLSSKDCQVYEASLHNEMLKSRYENYKKIIQKR